MIQRKRRVRLSLLAEQTRKTLSVLLGGVSLSLFVLHLFLMNNLAMQGYVLSRIGEENRDLTRGIEQLEAQIAKLGTQEYIMTITKKTTLQDQTWQRFVVHPAAYTASRRIALP